MSPGQYLYVPPGQYLYVPPGQYLYVPPGQYLFQEHKRATGKEKRDPGAFLFI